MITSPSAITFRDILQIPTGELAPVLGTFFDFSKEKSLGSAIDGIGGDPPGLDHCMVRAGTSGDGRAKVRYRSLYWCHGGKNIRSERVMLVYAKLLFLRCW